MSLRDFFDATSVLGYWQSEYGEDAIIGGDVQVIRGTTATGRDARGMYRRASPDTWRFTMRPLYDIWMPVGVIERARQNRCAPNTEFTNLGILGWVLTDSAPVSLIGALDAEALAAAGLSALVPDSMVLELDNRTGATSVRIECSTTAATIASAVPHALSVYARSLAPTGRGFNLATDTDATDENYLLASNYQRYEMVVQAPTIGGRFQLTVPPGEYIRFILPQMELGGYATSPIPTPRFPAGGTQASLVTRDGDTVLFRDAPARSHVPLVVYFSAILGAAIRELAETKFWHLGGSGDPRAFVDVTPDGDLRFVVRPGDGNAYEAVLPFSEARREDFVEFVAWHQDGELNLLGAVNGEVDNLAYLYEESGTGFVEFVGRREDANMWLVNDPRHDGFVRMTAALSNLLVNSERMEKSDWVDSNVARQANVAEAPDGSLSMERLWGEAAAVGTLFAQPLVATEDEVTLSVFIKKDVVGNPNVADRLYLYNITAAADLAGVEIDRALGVVTPLAGTPQTPTDYGSKDYGDHWRFWFTLASGFSVGHGIQGYLGWTGGTVPAGESGYFWGAQLVNGPLSAYVRSLAAAVVAQAPDPVYEPKAFDLVPMRTWGGAARRGETLPQLIGEVFNAPVTALAGSSTVRTGAYHSVIGYFIAGTIAGGDEAATSANAVAWTARNPGPLTAYLSSAYSPPLALIVLGGNAGGVNGVFTSPTGSAWTTRTTPVSANWFGARWIQAFAKFYLLGSGAKINASGDGVTWTDLSGAGAFVWRDAAYGNDVLVIVGDDGNVGLSYAYPAIEILSPVSGAPDFRVIVFHPRLQLFVAVATNGAIYTTVDGRAWTLQDSGTSVDFSGLAVNGDWLVATSQDTGIIWVSSDGVTWESRDPGWGAETVYTAFPGPGNTFVLGGTGGKISTIDLSHRWSAQQFWLGVGPTEVDRSTIMPVAWKMLLADHLNSAHGRDALGILNQCRRMIMGPGVTPLGTGESE